MKAPTQTVATASQGAEWSALMRAGRRGSVRIRGVPRRGASGSDTDAHASLLTVLRGDRHDHIIQHSRPMSRVRLHLSPPSDGTMVPEIEMIPRSILR
jgi:hypothetical protein